MRRWLPMAAFGLVAIAALVAWQIRAFRHTGRKNAQHPQQEPQAASTDALRWQLATLACGGPVHRSAHGDTSCPACPEGSDFAGQPSAGGDDSDSSWTLAGLVFGHFTSAKANEAVLKSRGCESHASGFGGDFLLRREGNTWRRVRYIQAGQIDNSCQLVHWTGGRDALVCLTGDMHQGVQSVGADLYTVEPAAAEPGDGQGTEFLGLVNNDDDCSSVERSQTLQAATIDGVDVIPRSDGRQDVAVRASIGRARGKGNNEGECPAVPTHPYRLVFRNDGDHFTAVEGFRDLRAFTPLQCCAINLNEQIRPYRY